MTHRGIIFDFNGVLFQDADLQEKAWQAVARDLRSREMTEEELATHMHGRPNAYVLSYLAGRDIAGQELLELIRLKESLYRELCLLDPHRLVLSPGGPELLEALAAGNVPRTIATSSEITNLRFFVQHLHLERWFEVGRIVYDDGVRPGKPAPDVYLAAARNIAIDPSECIVVEDAVSGAASAHAAGIGYLVGMGPPAMRARLLACPGVAIVIESLRDFPRERLLDRGGRGLGAVPTPPGAAP
jgi:beta-phosphoglucomutase-like phosphatase (HAD superfamily)